MMDAFLRNFDDNTDSVDVNVACVVGCLRL